MKKNRLWLRIVGVSVIGLLILLSGCDAAGAGGGGDDEGNGGDTPDVAIEVRLNESDLDGQSPVVFGDVVLGQSQTLSFVVRNVGIESVTLGETSFALTGADLSEFAIDTTNSASALAVGEETGFDVTFSPAGGTGVRTVTLTVSTGTESDDFTVELTGNGVSPPEATLELLHEGSVLDGETPVDYGAVSDGDSVSESFTIRNSGSATANLTGAKVTIAGTYAEEFVADTSSTADAIAPGESTTVEVFFTPTGVGSLTDETVTLSIESDAATGPPTIDLSFSVNNPLENPFPGDDFF